MLKVMENTSFFHFSHPIYYVLLLKSVIMLLFLPHVFLLFILYIRLFWSRLLFSFSWVINRAGFTPFMPVLNLPHFYFTFQFIRQQRSLVTIGYISWKFCVTGSNLYLVYFPLTQKITPRMNHPLVFMFIWSYFFFSLRDCSFILIM